MHLTTSSGIQCATRQACSVQAICRTHVSNKWSISKATVHDTLQLYWCGIQTIATTYITGPYHGPACGFPGCHCEGPRSSRLAHVGLVERGPIFSPVFRFPRRHHSSKDHSSPTLQNPSNWQRRWITHFRHVYCNYFYDFTVHSVDYSITHTNTCIYIYIYMSMCWCV